MQKKDEAFGFEKAEDSSGFLLWQVTTLWQRGIKKSLDEIDLTHPQFVLLASLLWLSGQKEAVTQIDLSHHTQIDPMTTSSVLRTLERKKLIERQPHPTDTRAKVMKMTAAGLTRTRAAIVRIEGFDDTFFNGLGCDQPGLNSRLQSLLQLNQG